MAKRNARAAQLTALVLMLQALPVTAGLPEGLDALKRNDYATAAKELRPLAETGDAEAQYRVGMMYEFGKGFPKNMTQAISWLRKAGNQGHTAAEVELGVIYMSGDGVAKDDAQAVDWFSKAAAQGSATAQYDLGMMYAKGAGVKPDNARAVEWLRKSADQGFALAQFEIGVAYENGEGVEKDPVLAYAAYAIAARGGNAEWARYRDDIAKTLTPTQGREAQALVASWRPGSPMPIRVASTATSTPTGNPVTAEKCSATGSMEGEKFSATHCAVAWLPDERSVAIWFNEQPISSAEVDAFQTSAYAGAEKEGRQRTLLQIGFCPGGGAAKAAPGFVKTLDFNSNHAKSPLAGVQWSLEAPKDFRVDALSGELKPGGMLAGHITGSHAKTVFTIDFAVLLPTKTAAAGMTCRQ